LLSSLVTGALAIAVFLPSTARADVEGNNIDWLVDFGASLLSKSEDGAITPAEAAQLVQEIVGAVDSNKVDIITYIDTIWEANVKAKAEGVFLVVPNLNNTTRTAAQTLAAQWAVYSKDAEKAMIGVFLDSKADSMGFAMNMLYDATIAAFLKAGWPSANVQQSLTAANRALLDRVKPMCTVTPTLPTSWPVYEATHTCTAANGEQAVFIERKEYDTWVKGPVNLCALREEAAKNSSWLVAKKYLDKVDNNAPCS
jgi:hypothetical protein